MSRHHPDRAFSPRRKRLLDVLRTPFAIEGCLRQLVISASIGIAAGDRASAGELLRDADTALYSAKAAGKNCYRVFAKDMKAAFGEGADLVAGPPTALEADEVFLRS